MTIIKSFFGALVFYTIFPLMSLTKNLELEFGRIARWAPLIGLLLGGLLALLDWVLFYLGMPVLTRTAVVVSVWISLTGGLHFDGVLDTADGLAVLDPERRLQVMKDSTIGAFAVMAGSIVLLLKVVALSDISSQRWLALMAAAGWGRWGQVVAIAFYPYLKAEGKGAFHRENFSFPGDMCLGLVFLLALSGVEFWLSPEMSWLGVWTVIIGGAIALLTGLWFYWHLGGHTGDTYGATVEWTEAIFLCLFTLVVG